ncbi:MAG: response regulator [Desulfobacterales bacterium]|nr:response regulator [Desulfobacterales bacterium]
MAEKTIVIIDDDENVSGALKRILEITGGYRVSIAENGKAGIKLVRKTLPDLVLLDIIMPGIDGFEVLKRLKSDTRTMSIPVVMVSSEADEESKIRGARLYTDLYITKPVIPEELLTRIAQVFKRHNS